MSSEQIKQKIDTQTKKDTIVSWPAISLIIFSTVWNFNNNISGFGYFGGTRVIIPWILIFALFLLPYALMVGELGSVFKTKGAGVASWIFETIGSKAAYLSGWIGWVVILPYISQRPSLVIVAFNWMFNQNGDISQIDPLTVQLIGAAIFLGCVLLASIGIKLIKVASSIAGGCVIAMFVLYIVLGLSAPLLSPNQDMIQPIDFNIQNFFPNDPSVLMSLAILVLGVGGSEKISPYVNRMKNPTKDFSKSMIFLVALVAFLALSACVAMGMMFGQFGELAGINDLRASGWITNGQYLSFQKLGELYNCGNLFLIMYALVKFFLDLTVMIVMIDLPLRMLAGTTDGRYIPLGLLNKNRFGTYPRFLLIIAIIVCVILILPTVGIDSTDALVKWLLDINSICMPLFYMCVFLAYMALKGTKKGRKFKSDGFVFIKNNKVGTIVGAWCFLICFFAVILQIINSSDGFTLVLNIFTPVILLGVGIILPFFARLYNKKHNITDEQIFALADKDTFEE